LIEKKIKNDEITKRNQFYNHLKLKKNSNQKNKDKISEIKKTKKDEIENNFYFELMFSNNKNCI
jgi:hypothetical protein